MEVLFEIFQLKEPEWTEDFDVALLSVGTKTTFSTSKFNLLHSKLGYKVHTIPVGVDSGGGVEGWRPPL